MLKTVCPKCLKTWFSVSGFILFCPDCGASMQGMPVKIVDKNKAEVADAKSEIAECFWCEERLVRLKSGERVCPNCGWRYKGGEER